MIIRNHSHFVFMTMNQCLMGLFFFCASSYALADQTMVISTNQTTPILLGSYAVPITESYTVIVNPEVGVNYTGGGDVLSAYMDGTANITLDNSGSLISTEWGVFTMTMSGSSGKISITNQVNGNIQADTDYAVYMLSSNNQDMTFVNHGEVTGDGAVHSENYAGAVVMQSLGNSNADFTNTGFIAGNNMQSTGGVVTIVTNGNVNINNSGTINSGLTGGGSGSGILVEAGASGGLIVNTGNISATTAIDIKSNGITVQLRKSAPGMVGDITGNINISQGSNNTLSMNAVNQINIDGSVTIGANNLKLAMADAVEGVTFLKASGIIDISGTNLVFDMDSAMFSIGAFYEILNGSQINGWFYSIDGVTASPYDPNDIYIVDNMQVRFDMSGGILTMEVIPEPSAYGLIAGAFVIGFVSLQRRRKIL